MRQNKYFFNNYRVFKLVSSCLLVLATGAHANEQVRDDSFFYKQEVLPIADESLQQIEIPIEVFKHSRKANLADLKLVDSQGNSVPFELTGQVEHSQSTKERNLAFYPLREKKLLGDNTEALAFSYNNDQKLEKVVKQSKSEQSVIVGYLIDFGDPLAREDFQPPKRSRATELAFELNDTEETKFLEFSLQQSNDLTTWQTVAHKIVLANLVNMDTIFQHNQLTVKGINKRYVRMTINNIDSALTFNKIKQIETRSNQKRSLISETIHFSLQHDTNSKSQSLVAHTQVNTQLSQISFEFDERSSMLSGDFYVERNRQYKSKPHWSYFKPIDLYQVTTPDLAIAKTSINLNGTNAKRLKLNLDYPDISQFKDGIDATVSWPAQTMTFLNKDNTSLYLVIGNYDHQNTGKSLIAGLKKQIRKPISKAMLGKIITSSEKPVKTPSLTNWNKIGLWGILIIGVILMGFMARKLLRQV